MSFIGFGLFNKDYKTLQDELYSERKANRQLEKKVHDLSMQVEKQKNEIFMDEQIIVKKEKTIKKLRKELDFKNTLRKMEKELDETIKECNGTLKKTR